MSKRSSAGRRLTNSSVSPLTLRARTASPSDDHAEVAVQGIQAVEDHGGRAGAGQRGGDFFADVPALADADDDDLAPVFQAAQEQADGAFEGRAVEPFVQTAQFAEISRSMTRRALSR